MNRDPDRFRVTIPRRTAVAPDWSTGPQDWQGGLSGWIGLRSSLLYFLLLGALMGAGCARPPEEERLRQAVAAVQSAAEARRPAAVVEWVSEDFIGSHGFDRDQLRRVLQAQMLRNASIGVTIGPLDVAIEGEHATVRFVALASGGSGGLIPDRVRGYRVVSQWRLEGGQWRVHRAEWSADPGS
jgi:hypothetical protein